MKKVKVSKKVDESIREAKAWYGSEEYKKMLMTVVCNDMFCYSELDLYALREITFDDLAKALYVGYEVEEDTFDVTLTDRELNLIVGVFSRMDNEDMYRFYKDSKVIKDEYKGRFKSIVGDVPLELYNKLLKVLKNSK